MPVLLSPPYLAAATSSLVPPPAPVATGKTRLGRNTPASPRIRMSGARKPPWPRKRTRTGRPAALCRCIRRARISTSSIGAQRSDVASAGCFTPPTHARARGWGEVCLLSYMVRYVKSLCQFGFPCTPNAISHEDMKREVLVAGALSRSGIGAWGGVGEEVSRRGAEARRGYAAESLCHSSVAFYATSG